MPVCYWHPNYQVKPINDRIQKRKCLFLTKYGFVKCPILNFLSTVCVCVRLLNSRSTEFNQHIQVPGTIYFILFPGP
jgi:hypothetical protein